MKHKVKKVSWKLGKSAIVRECLNMVESVTSTPDSSKPITNEGWNPLSQHTSMHSNPQTAPSLGCAAMKTGFIYIQPETIEIFLFLLLPLSPFNLVLCANEVWNVVGVAGEKSKGETMRCGGWQPRVLRVGPLLAEPGHADVQQLGAAGAAFSLGWGALTTSGICWLRKGHQFRPHGWSSIGIIAWCPPEMPPVISMGELLSHTSYPRLVGRALILLFHCCVLR